MRDATTFRGFCGKHDNSTFSPVEDDALKPTAEQLCLLAYRAFAYELDAKEGAAEVLSAMRAPDYSQSVSDERARQKIISEWESGFRLGLNDLYRYKERFDPLITGGFWESMDHLVMHLGSIPPFLVSGATFPEFDFAGHALQNLESIKTLEALFVSVVPGEGDEALAALSWFPDHREPARLADSLRELDRSAWPDALFRLVLGSFENVPISPDYWDGLDKGVRADLARRLQSNVTAPTNPEHLVDDGLRIASFAVTKVESLSARPSEAGT